jgi:hypothetical protein
MDKRKKNGSKNNKKTKGIDSYLGKRFSYNNNDHNLKISVVNYHTIIKAIYHLFGWWVIIR